MAKPTHDQLKIEALSNSDVVIIYNSMQPERELLRELALRRQKAGITQRVVAERLDTSASSISRLEAGGGKSEHSPSLRTLREYAHAINYTFDLVIKGLQSEID